ncbi:MAG: hypothetical protein CVU65_11135 [Deltaproteobacteria bacterium HGW-Deltaproteobacteria-22]|jgi:predicted regulator of Ras-like GTPase activity (Roadblock/LC7/MglB family)|nr:MAG: hypothetical protein CVU65_11135 [Deltaproteobacteria bacterium HGW-Deltaproteobacteria-22]
MIETSGSPANDVLTGSISLTNVSDLIQFIGMSGKTGELVLRNDHTGEDGKLYFASGSLQCVMTGELSGLPGLARIICWDSGKFFFTQNVSSPETNVEMPLNHAIMEAARLSDETGAMAGFEENLFDAFDDDALFDGFTETAQEIEEKAILRHKTAEMKKAEAKENLKETLAALPVGFGPTPRLNSWSASWKALKDQNGSGAPDSNDSLPAENTFSDSPSTTVYPSTNPERSEEDIMRESTEVLSDLLKVPGVDAVVVAGRDGFIIEAAGSSNRVNIDDLGAAIANTINGIEEMGTELNVNKFNDLFIEYGRAVIMCKPVGDAIAAIITPDASKLGIIRHKASKLFDELKEIF